MKYSKLLLIPLIVTSLRTSAQETKIVQKTAIVQKAVAIETQMIRERYVVYSLTALSVVQNIYPWVALYKGQPGAEPKKLSMFESIKAGFSYLFYTQEGWVSMAQAGISIGGAVIISKVCDKFVHPDTSRWYVHTHAPYDLTIEMMQERLLAMQDESLEKGCFVDHKQYVQVLYDRLVQQAESICAYMLYKSKRLDDEEKAIAKRAVRSMFIVQNCCLQCISVQLASDNFDYQGFDKLLVMYQTNINSQLNHFSAIEGETLQERYIVKRQIKQSLSC